MAQEEKPTMAKGKRRHIYDDFWTDPYIEEDLAEPDEKLLFVYWLTCPAHSITGIYEISTKKMSQHTGIKVPRVEEIISKLEADGKISYDHKEILIRNYLKVNPMHGSKIYPLFKKDLKEIHNEEYKKEWFRLASSFGYHDLGFTYEDVSGGGEKGRDVPLKPTKDDVAKNPLEGLSF